jgi:thioredoxin-like negative regulator of GroEL
VRLSVIATCVLLAAAPAEAAEWTRVETPNFIVYGETGERRVREVAEEFERFRDALARVISGAGAPAAVPTVVVVFESARSFEPYVPRYNGKPIKLGGYFFASDDMNIVALADGDRENSLRTIFHEYVHVVTDNLSRGMPVWLSEGIAEYYSTFQLDEGGRRAIVGKLIPSHLQLLNERRHLSIAELLAVETSSSSYNEGERQSLFYAQSWALVHMLVSGAPNRAPLLAQSSRRVADGTPSLDAWQLVFMNQNISRELERYVSQEVMKGVAFRFDRSIPPVRSYSSRVSAGDTEALLADLLRRVATAQEAAARFDKAVALQPPSARARALYGLLLVDGDQPDRALPLLLEASRETSDWLVQYHVASGITRIVTTTDNADPRAIATARGALAIVLSARPGLANALALSARLDTAEDGNTTRALEDIRRARTVSPGREDYIVLESFILMRRGEFDGARQLLAPLTGPGSSPAVRSNAQAILDQIALLEQNAADYVARLEGRRSAAPPAGASSQGKRRTVYRTVEPGEERVEGLLERVSCTSAGIALELNVAGMREHFVAPSLKSVLFISHRSDLRGAIACASRTPPDRVYLTWRQIDPAPNPRTVIAVEFLPDER